MAREEADDAAGEIRELKERRSRIEVRTYDWLMRLNESPNPLRIGAIDIGNQDTDPQRGQTYASQVQPRRTASPPGFVSRYCWWYHCSAGCGQHAWVCQSCRPGGHRNGCSRWVFCASSEEDRDRAPSRRRYDRRIRVRSRGSSKRPLRSGSALTPSGTSRRWPTCSGLVTPSLRRAPNS